MTFLSNLEAAFQKDEQWVIAEIQKGWSALQAAEKTAEVDILGIFQWIQQHQSNILVIFQAALQGATLLGALVPGAAPAVPVAVEAINAATAAINVLARGIQQGSTPLGTAVSAYHAVKDAQTAVNAVLKSSTTKPPTPAPAQATNIVAQAAAAA